MSKATAFLAMLGAGVCAVCGCKRESQTPKDAVVDYGKAVEQGDKALFLDTVYVEDREFAEAVFDPVVAMAEFRRTFDNAYGVELLGKASRARFLGKYVRADVDLKITRKADTATATLADGNVLKLIKKDGRWKVDLDDETPKGAERDRVMAEARARAREIRDLHAKIGNPEYDAGMIVAAFLAVLKRGTHPAGDPIGGVEPPGPPAETDPPEPPDAGGKTPTTGPPEVKPPAPPPKGVWNVPGWEDAPPGKARRLRTACAVVKQIPGRRASALVGVDFGPETVSRLEPAYEQFKDKHFRAFEARVAADAALKNPFRKTQVLGGVEYERMIAQTAATVATVLVAIKDGRCVAYWFWGHMDCFGRFVKALKEARIEP